MYMYVWMSMSMYVSMYVCMYVCMYVYDWLGASPVFWTFEFPGLAMHSDIYICSPRGRSHVLHDQKLEKEVS